MSVIMLKNVRLSFPTIWTPKSFSPGQAPKYSCNLLLDKKENKEQIKIMKDEIRKAANDGFHGDIPKSLVVCLEDGEDKTFEGYDNCMFVRCSSRLRPQIIDRDRTPLAEEDDKLHAGDYVNAAISLWVMDNQYGKRINSNLNALQFAKEGERFGGGTVSVDAFDDISKEQDADAADEIDDFLS